MPTLIIPGDDDQIVPIGASALRTAQMIPNATRQVYARAPHGLADKHEEGLKVDLLAFLNI